MRNFIDEIEEEMYKGEDFVTLGLNKFYEFLASMEVWETNAIEDKFTPERLLGVETTLGYITTIINERVVMLSSNNVYWYNLNLLKYYISDDSDETVSFDEYLKLFYDVEGDL